jgi:pantoate--beta-alanine ligase
MKTVTTARAIRRQASDLRRKGRTIGLVPTMGALHEGHLSLVRKARRECDTVVATVFVNPTQFGPREDFASYPRDLKSDSKKLRRAGADVLFAPSVREMYPEGFEASVSVGPLGNRLEGTVRPGHFSGVATVVLKLFHLIEPHRAYFGLKDFQQTRVILKMVRDLDLEVRIVACPTVREADGLAMSSRNAYLSIAERRAAAVLWKALCAGKKAVQNGRRNASAVRSIVKKEISREPLARIDYVAVADPDTLIEPKRIRLPIVILLAVRIGRTRLIDNLLVKPR